MKNQLHQRRALDALTLHVVDSRDVEKVILVVVGQVAFHLGRIHAAVWLRDIDGRVAYLWEDIDGHPFDRQHRAQRNGDQGDDHRQGSGQSR